MTFKSPEKGVTEYCYRVSLCWSLVPSAFIDIPTTFGRKEWAKAIYSVGGLF